MLLLCLTKALCKHLERCIPLLLCSLSNSPLLQEIQQQGCYSAVSSALTNAMALFPCTLLQICIHLFFFCFVLWKLLGLGFSLLCIHTAPNTITVVVIMQIGIVSLQSKNDYCKTSVSVVFLKTLGLGTQLSDLSRPGQSSRLNNFSFVKSRFYCYDSFPCTVFFSERGEQNVVNQADFSKNYSEFFFFSLSKIPCRI